MDSESIKITPEIIESYVRKAHVERSIAISKAFREATLSVKNIFSTPGSGNVPCSHKA